MLNVKTNFYYKCRKKKLSKLHKWLEILFNLFEWEFADQKWH